MGEDSKIELPRRVVSSAARKTGVTNDEWIKLREKGLKWCYCCKQWLHKTKFLKDNSRGDGLSNHCRECNSAKGTASRYKISIELARRLRSGEERCQICNRERKLEVDHDHKTEKIRGYLCSGCNSALGLLSDDKNLFIKCIEYLEKHGKNNN